MIGKLERGKRKAIGETYRKILLTLGKGIKDGREKKWRWPVLKDREDKL